MLDSIREVLKKKGIRPTPVRVTLLTYFRHKTTQAVEFSALWRVIKRQHPDVNRTTLWRNLKLFENRGLIHPLLPGQYTLCHQEKLSYESHLVLICQKCERVVEKTQSEVRLAGISGWRLGPWVWAVCPDCASGGGV